MVNGLYSSAVTTLVLLIATCQWVSHVKSARILAVQTVGAKSHWNFMSGVLRSLTDAGHSVTVFTAFPVGDRENYTEVDISKESPEAINHNLTWIMETYSEPVTYFYMLTDVDSRWCDTVYKNEKFDQLVHGGGGNSFDRKFDLIIMEPRTLDCTSYLANALNLPIIYTIPSPMMTVAERSFTGHVSNPASVSHTMAEQAIPKTFVQRFVNVALLVYSTLRTEYDGWVMKMTNPRRYQWSPKVNPSVIFLNTHHITEASRPVPLNIIEIGGIHLKPENKIPKDVLDFIEESPHGVIFFTFGSVVRTSSLPVHIEKTFKQVFANVSQRVLWKYENEMKDKPENVMIKKWLPQRDILLHPNVKLFISHGGISGLYEAVDSSVPVLGFPLFYDQKRNIDNLVNAQMAIALDLFTVTEETLLNSISEIINNENYTKNAKITSERFKDRPITPQQSVVYWTEYVIRHKGAPHLKYHGLKLTWYQYFLLDVISVILIFTSLVLFIIYKILKFICKYALKYKHSNKVKSQ
ncbi:UDP-glucuronosyltransferase 2B15-like [Melanaphis sacchari]|uniref:UDP-glucuronosyltransferase n=1 Tax=Melanaphis sacchari TaxID=742174 RepID=A0A2H8TDV4_9HEMI|nr:UDP-glucuronosyltransferase 2B15-like [Melanaphis sacchari]XP_025201746.1 UDP-glucuronosyltransferase 2B15-like [Melanaphis sacchari]XP_025201747.1 UDP-glucuronosyltransferase 2B15-like [Melanaphis sacchari]